MNKELLGFFAIFIALFVGAAYYSTTIQTPLISFFNLIKSSYHGSTEAVFHFIEKHTFQAKTIGELQEILQHYENNHLVMQQMASEIENLYEKNQSSFQTDPRVQLVRTISYASFNDFNRVWLEVDEYDKNKIYGLVYKELVAGIVINQNDQPLALLNRDIQSSYAVFIGDALAPGIAHGNNTENIMVKFIPAWFSIQKGDEVISSGLDNLFFKGLKVGVVVSVSKAQGYQTAIVKPYYNANNPHYFHMIMDLK